MNTYTIFYSIIAALYGLFIGSFLNVCIYRIPLNETLVTIPSHCTVCSHKLAWYDLFPLFSYLFLRGRCRYCGEHISVQYPIVEALNSVVWGITFYMVLYRFNFALNMQSVLTGVAYCFFFSALIVLSGIDIFHQIVPDRVNIFIFAVGIVVLILDYKNFASHLIGFFAVSVPLLILMLFNAMGGGDVKLYAAAGFLLGWKAALISLIIACLAGTIVGIPVLIKGKKQGVKHPHIPFVPSISIGMFIAAFWSSSIINWYIATFLPGLAQAA